MMIKNKVEEIEDKFQKGELLGEGAFGSVFVCKRKESDDSTAYALKELSKNDHKSGWAAHFLKNELVIMKQLNHPNCVKLIDIFQNEEKYFIVQELMLGSTL